MRMTQLLNPFDPKVILLAKHAQHVVLIHFPIGLYLAGTAFDFCARFLRRTQLAAVAHWNFVAAAALSVPTALTGLLAWHFALEGKPLKGLLRLHFLFGLATVAGLLLTVCIRRTARADKDGLGARWIMLFECGVSGLIAITAHLGGFLSGVNF